jgi:hypothetical protein
MESSASTLSTNQPFTNHYPQGNSNTTSVNVSKHKISKDLFYIHKKVNESTGLTIVDKAPVAVVINTVVSKISYVKIGHQVNVWGRLQFWPFPVNHTLYSVPSGSTAIYNFQGRTPDGNTNANAKTARVMIFPSTPGTWPYKNASTEKVIFPITVNMDTTNGATSPNAYVTTSDQMYYGVIFPGNAGFNILRVEPGTMHVESNESSSPSASQPNESGTAPYGKFLNLEDFEAAFITAKEVTFDFNFAMATTVNSYDTINPTTVRAMYNEGELTVAVGGK